MFWADLFFFFFLHWRFPYIEFMRRTVSQKDQLYLRTKRSMGVRFLLMFEKNSSKGFNSSHLGDWGDVRNTFWWIPPPPLPSLLRYKSIRRLGHRPSYSFTAESVPTAVGGRPRLQRSGETDEKERWAEPLPCSLLEPLSWAPEEERWDLEGGSSCQGGERDASPGEKLRETEVGTGW